MRVYDMSIPSKIGKTLLVLSLASICGCEEFLAQRPVEIQTEEIFRNLGQVQVVPDANRPLPDMYTAEPATVSGKDGLELFYFTKHHPPNVLAALIKEQLSHQVSQNPATNQLIVKCPNKEDVSLVLEFLQQIDVAPIQVKVDCLISEVFADLTMDYETRVHIEKLLGEEIAIGSFLPGASIRAAGRSAMGMKASITREKFDALIDILESRGYAKILMRPTVEVVNGRTARIQMKERIPIHEKILLDTAIIDTIKYQDIIDYLQVTPQVYSDGTIGLKTSAGIASKSTPDGVEQIPIITDREINNEENRLRKGQSLVIGGIIKTERMAVVRGVPLLKDIPILGVLFSSQDYEERAKEILFILTPSISSNGTDYAKTIDDIREKHAKKDSEVGVSR